jgi:excisionase family DNA binding protein
MKSFMTYKEVSDCLGISLGYIRILKSRGTVMRSQRVGRAVVIPRDEVERLISIGIGKPKIRKAARKVIHSGQGSTFEYSLESLVTEFVKHLSLTNKLLGEFLLKPVQPSTPSNTEARELKRINALEKENGKLKQQLDDLSLRFTNIEKNSRPTVVIRRPKDERTASVATSGPLTPLAP